MAKSIKGATNDFMRLMLDIPLAVSVIIAMLCLVILVVIIIINVFLRFVFNSGLIGAEEVASFILTPAFSFIGMALGSAKDLHIDINVLPRKLPAWFKRALDFIKWTVTLIIGIILVYFGIALNQIMALSVLPVTLLPALLQYIIMPVSGALLIIISVLVLISLVFKGKYTFNLNEDTDIDKIFASESTGEGAVNGN